MGRKDRSAEKREQIVWALFTCLSKSGHETVTIKRIAIQARLAAGVIHYYFQNKEQIFIDLIESLQEFYQTAWKNEVILLEESRRIPTGIAFLADRMVMDPDINRVLYNLVQMGFENRLIQDALRQTYRLYRSHLVDLFFPQASPGQQKKQSAILLGLVEGLALQWMIEPEFVEKQVIRQILASAVS